MLYSVAAALTDLEAVNFIFEDTTLYDDQSMSSNWVSLLFIVEL